MTTFLFPAAVPDCRGRLLSRARGAAAAFLALLISLLLATSAVRAQSSEEAPKGGLFFKSSDQAGVFYEAPILRTDVKLAVAGTIVRATVRQHFVNPSSAWLEGVYVFPLPEQSAVDHLVMEIGERRVVGQIKPREEAKKVYEQAAAAGQHASLVESERPNIFTTSVANIGPGEQIVVEIQYQDRVAIDAGTYSLRFPMVVGPRYIPGDAVSLVTDRSNSGGSWADDTARVPDASRITPPVLHPREGKINPVTMSIDFAPGFPVERVTSLYHPIVATDVDGSKTITLAEGDVPADRDFVLEWVPKPSAAPAASLFAEQRGDDVYLFAMLTPATAEQAEVPRLPRDVVFVIDTSGSMGGTSIGQAKAGLLLALERLTPADRFNVIQFNSVTDSLYGELKPWTGETLREARAYVDRLVATGGTEMRPALQLALDGETSPGRLKQVIFLTDAAVGNEAELFDDIARRLGDARLFTIGIGTAPNSYFMRKAAELGRGSFTFIGDVTEVGERMTELLRKLEQPAITGIAVRWPDGLPASAEMYPATVPDLYIGVPATFSARLPGTKLDQLSGTLAIEGQGGDATWHHGIEIGQARTGAGVAAVWARAKLSAIEDGQWRGADPARVREAATAHSLAYELVSSYTSLVAVDEEVVRPRDETLASTQLPTNLPHGWNYEKVFGPGGDGGTTLPQPGQLMRKINFTGTPLDGLSLPKTATPAMVHLLSGLSLTVAALTIHLLYRRRRTQGSGTDALCMAARRIA